MPTVARASVPAGAIPCFSMHLSCLPGDVNGNGMIDGLDIAKYVDIKLTDLVACGCGVGAAGASILLRLG